MRTAAMAACVMLAAGACGVRADAPPHIEVDRTPCAHCGMLISEPVFAAAYKAAGAEARVFDDIACLLRAVSDEAGAEAVRFWFHDAATLEWIEGEQAVFVGSDRLRTPMAGGLVAYHGLSAADRGAVEHQGRVIRSLDLLLATGGQP